MKAWRLRLIKWLLQGQEMNHQQIADFRACGWVLCPQDIITRDSQIIDRNAYLRGVENGKEFGKLQILRYYRDNVPTWEDMLERYDFKTLNEKYPEDSHGL